MIGEGIFIRELKDPVVRESLAIILGGGIEGARTHGMQSFNHLMGDFVRQYVAYCNWLGLKRGKMLPRALAQYLEA